MNSIEISVVIPAFNEEKSIPLLYRRLTKVMAQVKRSYELVFIDDGSTDNTLSELKRIRKDDNKVKIVSFVRNYGQTAAWDAGIKHSKGKLIITIDADLQNDPADIPKLIEKLESGYDVVSGWRYNRKDSLSKKFFSLFANMLRRMLMNEKIHDSGCSLKIYKRECFDDLDLRNDMYRRYITGILTMNGYKVGEIKTKHHPRTLGKTKYGYERLTKGFLELMMVAFLSKYSTRPIHFFGNIGILAFIVGFLTGLYLTFMKFFYGVALSNRPLLILAVLLVIVGTQFFVFGVLAEILTAIFQKVQHTRPYKLREVLL